DFRAFVEKHGSDGARPLPQVRAVLGREEFFFSDDDAFNHFRRQAAEKHPGLEVLEGGMSLPSEDGNASAVRLVRYELPESRRLAKVLSWLAQQKLPIADYFQHREELITGDLTPARYVLLPGEGEPVEIDG